jgi:hypothetical protein
MLYVVIDYITEKFWEALTAGALPVYWGAPNILDRAPHPRSFIDAQVFEDTNDLVRHLQKVLTNKTLYESYHTWRKEPLSDNFKEMYGFTEFHDSCRSCQWAFARRYGLGWNQVSQRVTELTMPRDISVGKDGLVRTPFVEQWRRLDRAIQSTITKESLDGNRMSVVIVDKAIRRVMREQDSVIDMFLSWSHPRYIGKVSSYLMLDILLSGATTFFTNEIAGDGLRHGLMHMLQNGTSRLTVTTFPAATISCHETSIRVVIDQLPLHIRIVVEDVDTFHKDAHKVSNYFGTLMASDFYNPIEAFGVS